MFLQEIRESSVPDLDQLDAGSLTRRLRHREKVMVELRQRFRAEYLGQLHLTTRFSKNTREPMVGEVVIIVTEN
ncbi:unnamed protein product, partial [Nesidiocoris tenuis]